MNLPTPPENADAWLTLTGFVLFILSEALGLNPRTRDNAVLQMVIHMARELFPYEVRRREAPTRSNRPRLRRNASGQFTSRRTNANDD